MKGILFNTDMVRAILDDRKTQTRRPIKDKDIINNFDIDVGGKPIAYIDQATGDSYPPTAPAPYQVGDILYVRETWAWLPHWDCESQESGYCSGCTQVYKGEHGCFVYKASMPDWEDKWRPSIHMPKEASRIFLRVTDIRAERVQDITEADAMAEGIHDDYPMDKVYCPKCKGEGLLGTHDPITLGHMDIDCHYCDTAKKRFVNFWDSLYAAKGYDWDVNPWVWKYTFERCEKSKSYAEINKVFIADVIKARGLNIDDVDGVFIGKGEIVITGSGKGKKEKEKPEKEKKKKKKLEEPKEEEFSESHVLCRFDV